MGKKQEELLSISLMTLPLKLVKTSELSVLVKKDLDIKDVDSIELSQILCSKEVTSQIIMVPVENQFMVKSLRMKISN
jgi:hypothetical protein